MIRLKNISKFYYSKGMISSGISKVNLEFNMGEFVVITGESGSGKTTLLNVISGLDSYEEGEMYVGGRETSHYMSSDFEEYRKRYIGNIFQDFNLVNSYTVYQNIELILLINGCKKEEIAARVPRIIERVGLASHAKTKVSKLSGGQKQRVAIARALAKDTDIIVADEPTGNLDSRSAAEICALLSEVAQDKLVIVVTHNYDQFEPYATRKIKMHDGKVAEDSRVKGRDQEPVEDSIASRARVLGDITAGGKLRLGIRNTFNIIPKFLLLLVVFLFVVFGVTSQYTTLQHQEAEEDKLGFNDYFYNYSRDRIVLKKVDGSPFTSDDMTAIANVANISSVILNDIMLDSSIYIESEDFSYETYPHVLNDFKGSLAAGRMPAADNEAIMTGYEDEYYFNEEIIANILDKTYTITVGEEKQMEITIVGCGYKREGKEYDPSIYNNDLYITDQTMSTLLKETYSYDSIVTTTINGKDQQYQQGSSFYRIVPNGSVSQGTAVASEELNNFFMPDEGEALSEEEATAKGKTITVTAENMFYTQSVDLQVADLYNKKNFTAKTGIADYDTNNGTVYVSQTDYDALFMKGNYQATVYVDDVKNMDGTLETLETMGYTTLPLKDTLISFTDDISTIIRVPMAVVLVVALFFIAYFVIRLILKSRSVYFSILRMLGMARKNIRRILDVEMLLVVNLAYGIFAAFILLVRKGYMKVEYIIDLVEYMGTADYVALYIITLLMAWLISGKFTKRLFRKTAMGAFREEDK